MTTFAQRLARAMTAAAEGHALHAEVLLNVALMHEVVIPTPRWCRKRARPWRPPTLKELRRR